MMIIDYIQYSGGGGGLNIDHPYRNFLYAPSIWTLLPSPLFVYWSPIYIHNYSVSSSWIVASNWKFSFSYAWHCFFLYICIVYIQNFEYFCDFELTTHITVSVGEGIVASNSLDSSPFPYAWHCVCTINLGHNHIQNYWFSQFSL